MKNYLRPLTIMSFQPLSCYWWQWEAPQQFLQNFWLRLLIWREREMKINRFDYPWILAFQQMTKPLLEITFMLTVINFEFCLFFRLLLTTLRLGIPHKKHKIFFRKNVLWIFSIFQIFTNRANVHIFFSLVRCRSKLLMLYLVDIFWVSRLV